MLFRTATEEDCEALAQLEMLLFPDNCFNETTIQHEMQLGLCYVVCDEGEIVGYLLGRKSGRLFDILRLGVKRTHQRTGLGSALLKAVHYKNPRLMLTVRKENAGAVRLYRHHGFQIVGELPVGAWVMSNTTVYG